jgi:hypothetical protein
MAIGSITYDDTTRREDLVDILVNISPSATPLLSGLQQTSAQNTLHEWLTDTLAASGDNAQAEGSAFSVSDPSHPTRLSNNTQIFKDEITVSGTQMSVVQAGPGKDPMAYQVSKQLKEHAKDIEKALMAGSRASGASGVARRLQGVINSISTNATARVSGSTLGETIFNDILELVYASTDMVTNEVYTGATLKRDISAFTAGARQETGSTS